MIVSMAMPCASIRRIINWLGRSKRLSRGSMPSYRLCEWVLAEHYCTEAECKASDKECKVPPVVLRHCSNTTQVVCRRDQRVPLLSVLASVNAGEG